MPTWDGVLIACDPPMKEFILKLDREMSGENSFVILGHPKSELDELDERHLLVKEDAVEMIQQKIEEMQSKNSFSRGDLQEASAAERKDERPTKRKKGDAT